jgi:NADH dehydrogenase/NADH:ubiquinone oxidoreductase subunit G
MLSEEELAQLTALIRREGGMQPFIAALAAGRAERQKAAALRELAQVIQVTVSDWPALADWVAANRDNAGLQTILSAITAAAEARDDSKLGPLMAALYAAVRGHFGV